MPRIAAIRSFDLFPQTRYLECVITLRKNNRLNSREISVEARGSSGGAAFVFIV